MQYTRIAVTWNVFDAWAGRGVRGGIRGAEIREREREKEKAKRGISGRETVQEDSAVAVTGALAAVGYAGHESAGSTGSCFQTVMRVGLLRLRLFTPAAGPWTEAAVPAPTAALAEAEEEAGGEAKDEGRARSSAKGSSGSSDASVSLFTRTRRSKAIGSLSPDAVTVRPRGEDTQGLGARLLIGAVGLGLVDGPTNILVRMRWLWNQLLIVFRGKLNWRESSSSVAELG